MGGFGPGSALSQNRCPQPLAPPATDSQLGLGRLEAPDPRPAVEGPRLPSLSSWEHRGCWHSLASLRGTTLPIPKSVTLHRPGDRRACEPWAGLPGALGDKGEPMLPGGEAEARSAALPREQVLPLSSGAGFGWKAGLLAAVLN